jgi:hypothetical protein
VFPFVSRDEPALAASVFHPVPSQSGQTSAAVLINFNLFFDPLESVSSDFAPARQLPASAKRGRPVHKL